MRHLNTKAKKLVVDDHFRLGGVLFRVEHKYTVDHHVNVHAYPINERFISILLVLPKNLKMKIYNQ